MDIYIYIYIYIYISLTHTTLIQFIQFRRTSAAAYREPQTENSR